MFGDQRCRLRNRTRSANENVDAMTGGAATKSINGLSRPGNAGRWWAKEDGRETRQSRYVPLFKTTQAGFLCFPKGNYRGPHPWAAQ